MDAPHDIETHPERYCPKLVRIYNAVKAHHEVVKHCRYKDGGLLYFTYPRLPWKMRNHATTDVLCADYLHYNTIQAARALKGTQHCATVMHKDGKTLISDTWDFKKGGFIL